MGAPAHSKSSSDLVGDSGCVEPRPRGKGGEVAAAAAAVSAHLASLAPASVDVEIRSLCLAAGSSDGERLLGALLRYFCAELRAARRFDLAHAHVALTLAVHQEALGACGADLAALRDALAPDSERLAGLLGKGLALCGSFLGVS